MDRTLVELETVLKALADTTRLRILGLLLTGEVCVCHIQASLKISQPKASRHLAYLRRTGLVATRRDGLWVHYRMAALPNAILETVHRTVQHTLRHVESVHKDLARLERRIGCCLPAEDAPQAFACCGDRTAAGPAVNVSQ